MPVRTFSEGFRWLNIVYYYRIVKRGRAVSRMMEGSPEAAGTMKDVANGWMDGWKNTERRGGNYYVCADVGCVGAIRDRECRIAQAQ